MDRKSRLNLIFRTILFFSFVVIFINNKSDVVKIFNYKLLSNIKIYHLCWIYLVNEILQVIIPFRSKNTYNGKLFLKHYKEKENYDNEHLLNQTNDMNKRVLNILAFWIGLNAILFYVYFRLNLDSSFVIMLFLFYYWSDMVCVNIWCPFHTLFMKNKCCNTCRIYNWDHIMFFTPFILIPNFWSYSLLILGLITAIQWEYQFKKHPERFSSISNLNLNCSNCPNECRFNKKKVRERKENIKRYKYEK